MEKKNAKKLEGHRKRLRERFLKNGLDGFLDYEVVELLLTLGTPRKDCKQMAKDAIKEFKDLRGVLEASSGDLQRIKGIGPFNIFGIKLFQSLAERYAKEKISNHQQILNSPSLVAEFLRYRIGREKKEHFFILLLDSHNCLIKEKDISIGTLDAALIHPREVFKEAFVYSAASIILAHNHPSGDPEASPEDIALTRRLEEVARIFNIPLIDHIIVTKDKYFSFKESDLI